MKNLRKQIVSALLAAGVAASAFAVTEEEIQKINDAMPEKLAVRPEKPRRLLVFSLSKGFQHSCIPYWKEALDCMAEKTGAFRTEHSEDMAVFTPENLARFDAVCFNNTTKLTFDEHQKAALMDFINGGKGIVGIHAATDNFDEWPEAAHMMGGIFKGHPWTANGTWAVKIDEPDHPLMKPFGGKGFKVNDEIYRTPGPEYSRARQRVLMSLDMSDEATRSAKGVTPEDQDTGLSWIKPVGRGRLFYGSLGHNHHLTWNRPVLEHYLAGIQYALGDLKVDDTPVIDMTEMDSLLQKIADYEWGQSRRDLTAFEQLIADQIGSPEQLSAIERRMQPLLSPEAKPAARDFACRQLSVWGSEISVPALAVLLNRPDTEHMARYALERIPDPAAEKTLIDKLQTTNDPVVKIGIITSLGVRRAGAATSMIGSLAADEDAAVAQAAIEALGSIANDKAVASLRKLLESTDSSRQARVLDALIRCGDRAADEGRKEEAFELYKALFASDYPAAVRVAALRGAVLTGSAKQAGLLLLQAFRDENIELRSSAVEMAVRADNSPAVAEIQQEISQSPEIVQVRFLAALAEHRRPVGRRIGVEYLAAESEPLRLAAIDLLAAVGDGTSIMPLAEAAATGSRPVQDAARGALDRVWADGIEAVFLKELKAADFSGPSTPANLEMIGAAGRRNMHAAMPLLLSAALSKDTKVQREAIGAIRQVALKEDIPAIVTLLKEQPNSETEKLAVTVIARQDGSPDAGALLAEWKHLKDAKTRAAFLRVLGQVGDPKSLALLRVYLAGDNPDLCEAAFRGLADWPGAEPIEDMKTLARKGEDTKTRVLAFRAWVRMIPIASGQNEEQVVEELARAYAAAGRSSEKQLVLGALKSCRSPGALALVRTAMEEPELKAEAQTAAVSICENLAADQPETVRPVLESIRDETTDSDLKQQAQKLLEKMSLQSRKP